MVAAWVLTTTVGLALVGTTGHRAVPAAQQTPQNGTISFPDLAQPLANGEQVSVSAAQAAVNYSVALPSVAAASQGNLTQAWVNKQQQEIALVYDGGKLDVMMWPATYQDPTSEFQTFIAENDATATMGEVNGQSALVITPNTDVNHSNPAWVEFDLNGIDVNIVSPSYGTDTLLSVADSMK